MRALILTIMAIFGITAVASAQTVETMTVRVGQQKTVGKGDLKVSFVKLIEDSRCPVNAKCVWAGNAKIKIAVSRPGEAKRTFELNTGLEPRSVTVFGYEIKLTNVAPYPGTNAKTDPRKPVAKPQTATFTITKLRRPMPKQ